ncbi:hypothetical protein [Coleofasciculus sp. F4-SAH-05]|uniref:hypothetical protein n=1 Tax=Coleofasciculus sp. F4-SAH-05 TaxID=3069525 RepID=UPI0032F6E20B
MNKHAIIVSWVRSLKTSLLCQSVSLHLESTVEYDSICVICVITKNLDQHKRDRMGLLHPSDNLVGYSS